MIFLPSKSEFMVGEVKDASIEVWDQIDPTIDLSTATATIAIFKEDDTSALAVGSATITGTTVITVKREYTPLTAHIGEVRVVAFVTYGGKTYAFQWKVRVLPSPAGQL